MGNILRMLMKVTCLIFLVSFAYADEKNELNIDQEDLPVYLERADRDKHKGWGSGDYFKLQNKDGRTILIDPNGKPFYSIGMVYAYGPDIGHSKPQMTAEMVLAELESMKNHGFNTLDLYGNAFLDDILAWCDENEIGVYLRTSYVDGMSLTPLRSEFPDFMDPEFREKAKERMIGIAVGVEDYHSILALDMDQRWLFGVDWRGQNRLNRAYVGPHGVSYFPTWLQDRYQDIDKLNEIWGTRFNNFSEVLGHSGIVRKNQFQNLDKNPWRLDIVEYALWTINDFQKELNQAIKEVHPNIMVTYTTELPEVIPFPISTKENSGLDFISPVHYNYFMDFDRDWASNIKLIVHTKFHKDLSGLSTYVNETGYRTNVLHQRPPVVSYAMVRNKDQEHKAELYLEQMSLSNVLPWMLGWSYFKWFDKLPEGDFGYVENNGALRPISDLGMKTHSIYDINLVQESDPSAFIFYPLYTLANTNAGFQQYKGLVSFIENTFIRKHKRMVRETLKIWRAQGDLKDLDLFNNLSKLFQEEWFPFAFTSSLDDQEGPVLLAGYNIEMLSQPDRETLKTKKTITFGPVGIYDERFRATSPWYLDVMGISEEAYQEKIFTQDLGLKTGQEIKSTKKEIPFLLPDLENDVRAHVSAKGQILDIREGVYTQLAMLMCADGGDVSDQITFLYKDGSKEEMPIAPTINDWRFFPTFNQMGWQGVIRSDEEGTLSYINVLANPSKTLVGIQLPNNESIWVFALSLIEGGSSGKVNIRLNWDKSSVEGMTSWLLSVRPGTGNFKVIASFENGWPAIIQSEDESHIAFLYDPLTWRDGENEISRQILFHEKLILKLIENFKA